MNFVRRINMKSPRFALSIVLMSALMSLSALAFAQSDAHAHKAVDNPAPMSDAQKSFDSIKTLAGVWTAKLTLAPPRPDLDDKVPGEISMRVTSRGNALVHEMYAVGVPDDPTRYDHPLTMLYLDGDRLTLVHYCDAGNRPRMVARPSPDGKTRSEEHTSELQSPCNLVCRLLLEKKKKTKKTECCYIASSSVLRDR